MVVAEPQDGGPHELDGLTATSVAPHFLPTLPANVIFGRQSQPPPMLLAQTPLVAPVMSVVLKPPTSVSNVLLTTRASMNWPICPCRSRPNACQPEPLRECANTLFSIVRPP